MAKRRDWKRAGQAVKRQRRLMGWTNQEQAAEAAGISVATWREVEQGIGRAEAGTLGLVERALRWPAGMIERIADGEDPPEHTDPDRLAQLAAEMAELRAEVRTLRGAWEAQASLLADWLRRGSQK